MMCSSDLKYFEEKERNWEQWIMFEYERELLRVSSWMQS